MEDQEWLVYALENWPITLALALVFLTLFLWICMPFALFGVKGRLDRMTRILEQIRDKKDVEKGPLGPAEDDQKGKP